MGTPLRPAGPLCAGDGAGARPQGDEDPAGRGTESRRPDPRRRGGRAVRGDFGPDPLQRGGGRRGPGPGRPAAGGFVPGGAGLRRPLCRPQAGAQAAGVQRLRAPGPPAAAGARRRAHGPLPGDTGGLRRGDGGRIPGHQRPAGRPVPVPRRPGREQSVPGGRLETEHLPLPPGRPGHLPGKAGALAAPARRRGAASRPRGRAGPKRPACPGRQLPLGPGGGGRDQLLL